MREERSARLADQFVTEALLPFLMRCRVVKPPSTTEVAALLWGFQTALQTEISAFDVGQSIRDRIADTEYSDASLRHLRGLIDALHLAEDAIPEVAGSFWYACPQTPTREGTFQPKTRK